MLNSFLSIIQIIRAFLNTDTRKERRNRGEQPSDIRVVRFTEEKKGKIKERIVSIYEDFLTPNRYSRPAKKRKGVKGIEIHWVANPGTSAKGNRNWFEGHKRGKTGFGSTHYIVDLDGDIVQMIPEEEIAYSSGARKYQFGIKEKLGTPPYYNTISVECTHKDWAGKMTDLTYDSVVVFAAYLLFKHNLTTEDLFLHSHITGKECHKWFVRNPEEWVLFKEKVQKEMDKMKKQKISIVYRSEGY